MSRTKKRENGIRENRIRENHIREDGQGGYERSERRVSGKHQGHRKRRKNESRIVLKIVILAAVIAVASWKLGAEKLLWHCAKVVNCGSDENGNTSGGMAGDQSGHEWDVRGWKDADWTCVLRYPDENVGKEIAALAQSAADNDLIGYNQDERGSFWEHLQASGYDPAQITVACNTDCSSSTAGIIKAVGYRDGIAQLENINTEMTTWNMAQALSDAGFEVLRDPEYLTTPLKLQPGDIILSEGSHVCIKR